jgi:hypothetical protein
MALIKCPECRKEVSDKAVNCPFCGYAFRSVTVEQTGKVWKLVKLMSVLMLVVGAMFYKQNQLLSNMLLTFGVIFFIVSSFGKWWNNR